MGDLVSRSIKAIARVTLCVIGLLTYLPSLLTVQVGPIVILGFPNLQNL